MRFTTAQLREAIINPARLVSRLRTPIVDARSFGNPQRAWMEASWRAYFADGRNRNTLWKVFNEKVANQPLDKRRASLANGAIPMLERFVDWDAAEPSGPTLWNPPSSDLEWEGHILSLKRDALYLTESGYHVRVYWTDHELSVSNPNASLMAAALLVYSEVDLGADRIASLDGWQLRKGERRFWTSDELADEKVQLMFRMNEISAALQG
jgi:hypothetical protein